MTIDELKESKINHAIAYIIGLSLPLYKTIQIHGVEYFYGSVNHNANMVSQEDLAYHYNKVLELLNLELGREKILLLANQNDYMNINLKKGFTILIEKNGKSDADCIQIMLQKVEEIEKSSIELKKEFIKACFDGRSSWDTTAHYLSIDVDRDYPRQDLIKNIINTFDIDININRRDKYHDKNDQIRIKKNSILKYINQIGFYSRCREKLVVSGLKILGR